jgi:hypothetical protein
MLLDNFNYMYFGASPKTSLKDYGMVCRRERSDQYYFIYKINEGYEEGFVSETDIKDFMNGESGYSASEINTFLNTINHDSTTFLKLPMLEQVYKLSEHFGVETILGKSISPLTLATALDIIEKE